MKKILIVFPDPTLSFSPFTLNLYDSLSIIYDVTILTFEPISSYSSQKIIDKKVIYLKRFLNPVFLHLIMRGLRALDKRLKLKNYNFLLLLAGRALPLIREIKKFDGEIIAVDFFALWCVGMAKKKAHLLSLEIYDNDLYKKSCPTNVIKSVIIQSEERYKYLFGNQKLTTFLVQNAPNYIDEKINLSARKENELIFCGSAMPGFGIFRCLEFLEDFPEYRLTVKGAIPDYVKKTIIKEFSDLFYQNRLVLNEEYLSPSDLNSFLSNFRIGFVFYDYIKFDYINTFNYKSAPSGKLFQYYNAGLPVVSNNISGLNSIKEFKTGVMINSMDSDSIKNAIDQIELDYENYAIRSKNLSARFDFSKNMMPFIDFLKTN
jgi:glycosyltransferase involved in cell wall biosynthesis